MTDPVREPTLPSLALTLGALAEIEHALEVDGIEALAERFKSLRYADYHLILTILLREAGDTDPDATIKDLSPADCVRLVASAFRSAFL